MRVVGKGGKYLQLTDPSRGLPNPKIGQRLPKVLSVSELQQLFAAFDEGTPTGRRDKLFFQLSYAGGLRITEVTSGQRSGAFAGRGWFDCPFGFAQDKAQG